jgi:FkbM family methyltransferase
MANQRMRRKKNEPMHGVVLFLFVASLCLLHHIVYGKAKTVITPSDITRATNDQVASREFGFCVPLDVITASDLEGTERLTKIYSEDIWETVEFAPVPKYMLNIHNPVTEDIFISGSTHAGRIWDPYIWDLFVRILQQAPRRPGLVVDVGANIGYFTMMAAALGYDVISFEPMAHNLQRLRSSVSRNGFGSRVSIIDRVAAQTAGAQVVLVATHSTNQGNGHIVNELSVDSSHRYYSKTTTLDAVLVPMKQDILLMKIDVEGSEAAVLDGAYGIMHEHTVYFITLEISDATRDNKACSLVVMLRTMQKMGYIISDVTPGAAPLSTDSIDHYPPNILLTLSQEHKQKIK